MRNNGADVNGRPGLTFVFTDIEGSTQLLRDLRADYGLALRIHRRILSTCFEPHGGRDVGSEGDGLFFVFNAPESGVAGAVEAQQKLEHYAWPDGMRLRVRIGVHCGPVTLSGGEYVGLTVHEVARICAAAHGGQILCSAPVAESLRSTAAAPAVRELGTYLLRGFPDGTTLFQVAADGLEDDFPPPRGSVRDGGVQVSVWRRHGHDRRPQAPIPVALDAVRSGMVGEGVELEVGRASTGPPGAFRLVVLRSGTVEEEYDGLTLGGVTGVMSVVNAHSRLISIEH
jgi:class 3 adenylate cyclase